jgi:preprotein translocase subunit SecG
LKIYKKILKMVYTVITILILIVSVLLIGVVLIQNSKGGGLASSFSAQNQIMGVKKTTDFVEKATWVLVSVLVLLSVASFAFKDEDANAGENSEVVIDLPPTATPQDFGTQAE